jgi:hypothetical protein
MNPLVTNDFVIFRLSPPALLPSPPLPPTVNLKVPTSFNLSRWSHAPKSPDKLQFESVVTRSRFCAQHFLNINGHADVVGRNKILCNPPINQRV